MNATDFVFLGLKNRVTALGRGDGQIVWTTQLPGAMGAGFVTLTCDECRIFAYAGGKIHCLDLLTGQLLWTNELEGFGYGIASICVPGGPPAPATAAFAEISAQQQAAHAANAGAAGH